MKLINNDFFNIIYIIICINKIDYLRQFLQINRNHLHLFEGKQSHLNEVVCWNYYRVSYELHSIFLTFYTWQTVLHSFFLSFCFKDQLIYDFSHVFIFTFINMLFFQSVTESMNMIFWTYLIYLLKPLIFYLS